MNAQIQIPFQSEKRIFWKCDKCSTVLFYASEIPQHHCLDTSPYLPAPSKISIKNRLFSSYNPAGMLSSYTPHTHRRGIITGFSRKSARRMKLKISGIDYDSYKTRFFLTYTFHEILPENRNELHRYLNNLLKRFERAYPDSAFIWRIEFQKRGAPHFHIIFLSPTSYNAYKKRLIGKFFKDSWGHLTASINSMSFTRASEIIELNQDEKIFTYVSKYCAKCGDKPSEENNGRLWGIRGKINYLQPFTVEIPAQVENCLRKKIYSNFTNRFKLDDFYGFYLLNFQEIKILIPFTFLVEFLEQSFGECGISPPTDLIKYIHNKKLKGFN